MKIPSPAGMTLRQKLIEADKLTRELTDHLERGFVPKVHNLRRVTRHGSETENDSITDLTVRSTLIESSVQVPSRDAVDDQV